MDASARSAVLDAIVEHFHVKVMDHNFPPDDTELPGALRREVDDFFENIDKRLGRLEHPMDGDW